MERIELVIPDHADGMRLDAGLSALLPGLSRSMIQKDSLSGRILINGKTAQKKTILKKGDMILYEPDEPKELSAAPQNIPIEIVYEDDDLLVVNKPKGMVVHPAPGHEDGTLVNALLFHCAGRLSSIGGVIRPGIVHRIDKDTSGLLMVAKNDRAHRALSDQIKDHSFTRIYHTVVYGGFREEEGIVNASIARSKADRKKMAVDPDGREALTKYKVLARYEGFTYLECRLFTGRTHQIRVHLASKGHPVAGDEVYGPKKSIKSLQGQCLHAKTLGFVHPVTKEYMEFTSDLPDYFKTFLKTLRLKEDR